MKKKNDSRLEEAIKLLNLHHDSFYSAVPFARETGHPVPSDTRGWSQILITILTGIKGRNREKGPDLLDGSDVKAASTWEAIDTPRFNGVIKAGTKAATAGKLESLDQTPFLFFVLWDHAPATERARCRVWVVQPKTDTAFRRMCRTWYERRDAGVIQSNNFQLHPPRGKDSDVFRNECGNLHYPLLLRAERGETSFDAVVFTPGVMKTGSCHSCT